MHVGLMRDTIGPNKANDSYQEMAVLRTLRSYGGASVKRRILFAPSPGSGLRLDMPVDASMLGIKAAVLRPVTQLLDGLARNARDNV